MPTATFSLPALPTFILMVFISLLATHSLLVFPSSTCSLDIFQCPRTRRQVSLKQLQQRGKDTERGCIVSPQKVPVWLSAPCRGFRHGMHVLRIWWCKTHIWKRVRRPVGGLEQRGEELTLGSPRLKSNTVFTEEPQYIADAIAT